MVVGLLGDSLVSQELGRLSALSDDLILSGCTDLIFDHLGHDSDGKPISMSTAKFSLLGLGHRSMAILGVTRLRATLDHIADRRIRASTLCEKWSQLESLDADDRQIALQLVGGQSVGEIAAERSVSTRTIENRRMRILKQLDVDSPLELAKLLIKLQENGFGDLHL